MLQLDPAIAPPTTGLEEAGGVSENIIYYSELDPAIAPPTSGLEEAGGVSEIIECYS